MMLDSDGKAIQVGKTYRVSWQKFAGSCARYNFTCVARQDPFAAQRVILYDTKSHQALTEDYLRRIQAKIHRKK